MVVSFDIMFTRRDQKQYNNGKAYRTSLTSFWSSLINLIPKDTHVVFYFSCVINRFYGEKTARKMKSTRSFVETC